MTRAATAEAMTRVAVATGIDQTSDRDSTTQLLADRYELLDEVGRGGTGIVYRAIDTLLKKAGESGVMAVKVMNGKFDRPGSETPILQEVARSKELSHPNIVRVFDAQLDGDRVFMTMELLEGETLKERLRRDGLIKIKELDSIMRGALAGLAECHARNIVHSDIKPANIFITRSGEVRLLDLGVARLVGAHARFQGYTEQYASPGQIAEEPPAITDDVFSMACTAYECATGRTPFGRIRADHARDKGLKPVFDRSLPKRYRRALNKALSFDVGERPSDAAAFWRLIDPARQLRERLAAVGALGAAIALVVFFKLGIVSGIDQIQVSAEDRRIAEENYQHAMSHLESTPETARQELVKVLALNPYHEKAAEILVHDIRTLLGNNDPDGEGNALLIAAIARAPNSDALIKLANQRIDQVLTDYNRPAGAPFDLFDKNAIHMALCGLRSEYRRVEVQHLKSIAQVNCSASPTDGRAQQ